MTGAVTDTFTCRTEVGQEVELVFEFDRVEELGDEQRELRGRLIEAYLDQQRITIFDDSTDRVWANCLVTGRNVEDHRMTGPAPREETE